jgi:hypothetical protein
MTQELNFETLFEKAIKEWPKVLTLKIHSQEFSEVRSTDAGYDVCIYTNLPWDGNKADYIVKGLYKKSEDISVQYYNTSEEILFINLHDAIARTIRDVALYVNKINTRYIRHEITKKIFENILKEYLCPKRIEEIWSEADIDIVKEYFKVNAVSGS